MVGRIIYLARIKPEISYSVPAPQLHPDAATRVLHYIKGTNNYGLFIPNDTTIEFQGFVDSNGDKIWTQKINIKIAMQGGGCDATVE